MDDEKKSTIIIKNGYCCGHGDIIHRLESWCIKNDVEYRLTYTTEASSVSYLGKTVLAPPSLTLRELLDDLGLSNKRNNSKQ